MIAKLRYRRARTGLLQVLALVLIVLLGGRALADGTTEHAAEGTLTQRQKSLLLQLSNAEVNIAAINKVLRQTGYKVGLAYDRIESARKGSEIMDRKGGGPVRWDDFYGRTARDFYAPESWGTLHREGNGKTVDIKVAQNYKQLQRPSQFDYIYKANSDQVSRASEEIASLKHDQDALLERRRYHEAEECRLWATLALERVADQEIQYKPLYRFRMKPVGPDTAMLRPIVSFLRTADAACADGIGAVKDDQGEAFEAMNQRMHDAYGQLQASLADALIAPGVTAGRRGDVEALKVLCKRIAEDCEIIGDSYTHAIDSDKAKEDVSKLQFREELQSSLAYLAAAMAELDQRISTTASAWGITGESGVANPDEAKFSRRAAASAPDTPGTASSLLLAPPVAADSRTPVPDAAARAASLKVVRETFADDLAAKTAAAKSAVAKKLLHTADDSKSVPADYYALLETARANAIAAADLDTALAAIDKLNSTFAVDGLALKADAISTMLGANLSPAEKTSVLAAAEAAVNQAILANRFDAASRITRLASPEAQKSGSGKTWEAISAKIQSLSRGYAEAAAASKILQQKPDDPAANFSVGSYLCFEKGQWTAGLPFLARGNDTEARDMALRDLAGAADANAQSALGDAWWDLAKKRTTKAGEIERRAAFWYRQAGPGLSGLARAKVEMRVKEADSIANAADSNPGDHEVNLLALFAHHSKQISGQWEMSSEGLSCAKGGQLLFEYSPPEEYDLQIEFTQRTGRDSFAIICPLSQGSVEWMAGGWGNHVMGFVHLADGGWHALTSRNVDGVLKDGKRNTATIRVRRGSAQAIFNGALVSELPGDGKGFSVGENTINGKPVVGLSIDGYTSAIIYKMQIVEVTGSHGVSAERAGEPLASLQFVENMGYTIGELRKGNSTHNNDDYPLTEVPAAMIGKPFTKFVAGKPGSVSFKFTTSGKIFILAVEWPGYPSQAAVLKHIAKKEPMRVVGSKETFEVWSITAEAGKRIDLPFQEILVADHLEKVAKLDDR